MWEPRRRHQASRADARRSKSPEFRNPLLRAEFKRPKPLQNNHFRKLICPTSDFCESLSSPLAKNILLPFFKIMIIVMTSHPGKRGERVVTNVGRDAMDAICVARRAARTRTTKSCGPGAPGLALSLAGDLRGDGDYEVTDTGESTKISVNTIAQGRPDVSVEPVVNNSCAFLLHTRLRVRPAPGLPCALFSSRDMVRTKPRTGRVAGMLRRVVIASEAKQSRASRAPLDCFVVEPVIGPRVRADPLAPRNDDWLFDIFE
jgi:hypothetical protein